MRQLKEKTNLLVLILMIFSLSFCTALDEATTTEDSASATGTSGTSTADADCTAAAATTVYTVYTDQEGQDTPDSATWSPTYGSDGSDGTVALDDSSGPKCGNVAAKLTRSNTTNGWMAGGVSTTADWSSYNTLKLWVKADSSSFTARGFSMKLSDTKTDNSNGGSNNVGDTAEVNFSDYGFSADGTWKLVKIPLADFSANLNKANIDNIIWIANGLALNDVVYFDEVYVDASGETTSTLPQDPTAGPSDPTVSGGLVLYSEASGGTTKTVDLNPSGGWYSGIVPTEVTLDDGKKVRKYNYSASDWQINVISGGIDISGKTFYADVYSMSETQLLIVFESGGYPNNPQKSCTVSVTAGQWTTVSLDNTAVNSCADVAASGGGTFSLSGVNIVHIKTKDGVKGKVFYLDNIYAK